MKNTMKIRMIGAAALLGIGASAFPSLAAAKIQQLSVYIIWKGSDSAGWSYLNADGYAATGWFEIGDQWYFSDENGSLLTNTVAPDGYRVDGSGAWVH